MLMPSIFGEDLFDAWMDFPFERENQRRTAAQNPLYGKNEKNLMKTDIRENNDSFDIEIDLPGYKKEDVQAELKDGYMTINASRNSNDDKKDEEGNYIRRERYYGSCSRSFYVGKQITEEDIKAKFEDGILKISVPKKEVKKEIPEKKYIAIEG